MSRANISELELPRRVNDLWRPQHSMSLKITFPAEYYSMLIYKHIIYPYFR